MHECSICFKRKKHFTVLNCDHEFCTVCWNKWKQRQLMCYGKSYPTCPTCRREQKPDDYAWMAKALLLLMLYFLLKGSPTLAKTQQKV